MNELLLTIYCFLFSFPMSLCRPFKFAFIFPGFSLLCIQKKAKKNLSIMCWILCKNLSFTPFLYVSFINIFFFFLEDKPNFFQWQLNIFSPSFKSSLMNYSRMNVKLFHRLIKLLSLILFLAVKHFFYFFFIFLFITKKLKWLVFEAICCVV